MISKLIVSIGLLLTGAGVVPPVNEEVLCEIHDLDSQGFVQLGEYPEYVCENVFDDTDFIVIEDEFDEFRVGDFLRVELNPYGELVDYEVIEITKL